MSHFSHDHIRGAVDRAHTNGVCCFMFQEPHGKDHCTSRRRRTSRRTHGRCRPGHSCVWTPGGRHCQQNSFRFKHCRSTRRRQRTSRRRRSCRSHRHSHRRSTRCTRRSRRHHRRSRCTRRSRSRRRSRCTRRSRSHRRSRCTRRSRRHRRHCGCGRQHCRCGMNWNRFWF